MSQVREFTASEVVLGVAFDYDEEPLPIEDILEVGKSFQEADIHIDDPINHPSHYTQYEGFEVIDVTKQLPFLEGNAVKYILRAPFKNNEREDIEKAIWYLKKKLEEIDG